MALRLQNTFEYLTDTLESMNNKTMYVLSFQGNEILSGLSQDDYESMIGLLEAAILATDLALYFK